MSIYCLKYRGLGCPTLVQPGYSQAWTFFPFFALLIRWVVGVYVISLAGLIVPLISIIEPWLVPLRGPAEVGLALRLPVDDVFISAGGPLVFFGLGRDFRRGGALSPEDGSSKDEDCIDEVGSVGRGRSWKLVPGKLWIVCSIMPCPSGSGYYRIRLMNDSGLWTGCNDTMLVNERI